MAKPVKFYYDFLSQPARALYMFMEAAKIPYEPVQVALTKGEHLTPEFKKGVNRFQKVPAIIDNDFKLSESIAIFRYLSRSKLVPDHWYPKEIRAQAKIDEYLEWQHENTRFGCSSYFRTMWLDPVIKDNIPNADKIEEAKELLKKTLDNLEQFWIPSESGKFFFGDKISIADLLAACEIEQTRITGYNPCDGRPKLSEWLSCVKNSMNPYYDEAHKFLNSTT